MRDRPHRKSLSASGSGSLNSSGVELVNLYGGFFSICMYHAGLWGFNNGLGYSESRDWPQLEATGAAPARYYVPRLHAYLPVGTAQALIEVEPEFRCPCVVCEPSGELLR